MAHFIVEEKALQILAAKDSNYLDLIEYLDKTLGEWGSVGDDRWMSPRFTAEKLSLTVAILALKEMAAARLFAELHDYPTFAQFTPAKYDNQTPSYLPGGRLPEIDDNGEPTGGEIKVTWDKWKGENQTHFEFDGEHYVPLVHNGQHITGNLLVELVDDGITVKGMNEWPKPSTEGEP
jgi:hypothetical protein